MPQFAAGGERKYLHFSYGQSPGAAVSWSQTTWSNRSERETSMAFTGYAALPTGETMNPRHPQDATYFDADQTAYVLFKTSEARTRPTRVFTSFGSLGIKIGDEIALYHDQTGAQLGTYRVSGIHHYASGEMAGEVPDIRIKHCVAK